MRWVAITCSPPTSATLLPNGNAARLPCPGDNFSFAFILARAQHLMGQIGLGQQRAELFGVLYRAGPYQDRPPLIAQLPGATNHRLPFCLPGPENPLPFRPAAAGSLGRYRDYRQTVHSMKFPGGLAGGAGGPRQPHIAPEKSLIADPRQGLALAGDLTPLLGFDHLVQALLPGAVLHDPARVLVDDLHRAILHQIMTITMK